PAHPVYLTDGPSREVVIGRTVVKLRHASPKHLIAPGSPAGTVVQALRYLGKDAGPNVTDAMAHSLSVPDLQWLVRRASLAARVDEASTRSHRAHLPRGGRLNSCGRRCL